MSVHMVVTRQKVTKQQRRRRNHARFWQFGTLESRANHFISPCDICDEVYGPIRGVNRKGVINVGGVEVYVD